jgi:tetratricopeptide (TPR) repeat protein
MLDRAEPWQQQGKWREALTLFEQARDLVGERGPEDLRREVEGRVWQLELVKVLDAIRQQKVLLVEGTFDESRADPEYEAAFARAGLASAGDDPAAVARRVEGLRVREQVVAALDDWALTTKGPERRAWLLQVARHLDPDPLWRDRFRRPDVWDDRAALEELAARADLARLSPSLVSVLARRLWSTGGNPVPLFKRAQALHPTDFLLSFDLGLALGTYAAKPEEAEGYFRTALAVRPESSTAWYNLGTAQLTQGRRDEAVAAFERVIALDPKKAGAHTNLGIALREKGRLREAVAAHQEAVALDPNDANAHYNRGVALYAQGRVDEALAAYERAVALNPDYAMAHINRGAALQVRGRLDEAVAAYGKGIALNDHYAEAHCNLGIALLDLGRFAEALAAMRRGHELGSRQPSWRTPSAAWVKECERLVELDCQLPAVLRGDVEPGDATFCLGLARVCRYKKRYRDAARFCADAFERQPQLAEGRSPPHRYKAACFAALAGAGQGVDPAADEAECMRLRHQALGWLRAELAAWRDAAEKGPNAEAARRALTHWKGDKDLTGVRDAGALAKLPEEERADWRRFWADVDDLLARLERTPEPKGKESPP